MRYQDLINRVLKEGFEEVEVYATTSKSATYKLENEELSTLVDRNLYSVTVRAKKSDKMCYAMTESLKDNDIEYIINQLNASFSLLNSEEVEFIYDGSGKYTEVPEEEIDADLHTPQEKIDLLKKTSIDTLAKSDKIKKIGYSEYSETEVLTEISNSKGLNLSRTSGYMSLFVGAVAVDKDDTKLGFGGDMTTKFNDFDTEKIVKDAVNDSVNMLNADFIKTGKYPVVFRDDIATEILGAFLSVFSGEAALKKLSNLVNKENTKVFGDNITIVDDPFDDQALFKVPFDDEGVPCAKKNIVENGVFKTFLHSQKTANHFGVLPTGNGFKMGASISVGPCNLKLENGTLSRDEIIATIDKGVFITSVQGLHAGLNPISGSFNVQSSGYLIENGKISKPITLFVTSGNFFEMFNAVELISNDHEKYSGVYCPSIKIKELMISGK